VLLINMGTPQSPKTGDVRSYLSEFLNDARVIDLPWLGRKMLVNLIIVPFRAPKSARHYQELWSDEGSPLMIHSVAFKEKLQKVIGTDFKLEMLMRYGKPSLKKMLKKLESQNPEKLLIVPMYPQYASSTTGSAIELVMNKIRKWKQIPDLKILHHFHDHPAFIGAMTEQVQAHHPNENYDHVVMSYHGLPQHHTHEAHQGIDCESMSCREKRDEKNKFCYLASCYETSRLLAEKLSLSKEKYTVSFQSRMSDKWTKPFTEKLVLELAGKGVKKILVISPAFVADCLETTNELGVELRDTFLKAGGEELKVVESLNDQAKWVDEMAVILRDLAK